MAVKDVIQNYSINQNCNKMKYIAKLILRIDFKWYSF